MSQGPTHDNQVSTHVPAQANTGEPATAGWRSALKTQLRGMSFRDAQVMLKPEEGESTQEGPAPTDVQEGQRNPALSGGPATPVAVTGEITIDASGSDVANQALVAMETGSTIEQNTRTRIVAGTHKLAYLEELAVHPDSEAICRRYGRDHTQFTVKLDPWTGAQMFIQNNAAGFAIGQNIVGSRAQSLAFWRTSLLCHEVNHIVNGDPDTAPDSFERYAGEFRAYWVAGLHTVADLDDRAAQIKTHLLGAYPLLRNKYDTDRTFKGQVDGHTRPASTDNLDNHS